MPPARRDKQRTYQVHVVSVACSEWKLLVDLMLERLRGFSCREALAAIIISLDRGHYFQELLADPGPTVTKNIGRPAGVQTAL